MFAGHKQPSLFEDLKQYVGFTSESTKALRELRQAAVPHYAQIVDDFYETIQAHPDARAAISGGDTQLVALKRSLTDWIDAMLSGPHDDAYFEARTRIGEAHVRLQLPQVYLFTAMSGVRNRLDEVLHRSATDSSREPGPISCALHQILDLELAIMLESYRNDLIAKSRSAERLAATGQFAASIGHELRTPLAIIDSSAFLLQRHLQREGEMAPVVAEHLDRIQNEVRRSTNVISDLLALAQNRPPRRVHANVWSVVNAALETASLATSIDVEVSVSPALTGTFDPEQIRHVLVNLLANASEAQGGKGRIWIQGSATPTGVLIRVRDDGPGVDLTARHEHFESPSSAKTSRTGLAFALCRRIVESHGGDIDLEMTEGGAVSTVTLPRRLQGEGAAPMTSVSKAPQ